MVEIAVSGIGVVSPLGIGRRAFITACHEQRHGIGDLTLCEPAGVCEHAAEVSGYDWKPFCFSKQTYLDRTTQLLLGAARLALEDSAIPLPISEEAPTVGFCLGTRWGCLESAERFYDPIARGKGKTASSLVFSHSYPNCPTSFVAIELGLRGYSTSFTGSRLAGLWALRSAFDAIRLGAAERALVAAVDAISAAALGHAEKRGELPDTRRQKPPERLPPDSFWARVPGEGAVCLSLETAASVQERKRSAFCTLTAVAEETAAVPSPLYAGCGDANAAAPFFTLLALLAAAAEGETIDFVQRDGSSALRVSLARKSAPLVA